MTDTDERARFDAWWTGEYGWHSIRAEWADTPTDAAWMAWRAQAEEIERLRAGAEELMWDVNASLKIDRQKDAENERLGKILDRRNDELLNLEVEIKRLRAALKQAYDEVDLDAMDDNHELQRQLSKIASIARAALSQGVTHDR